MEIQIEVGQKFVLVDAAACGLLCNDNDIFTVSYIDDNGNYWDMGRGYYMSKGCMLASIEDGYVKPIENHHHHTINTDKSNHERDNKYLRTITNRQTGESIQVDVYDVLNAFRVECPCMAHGIKKALVPGGRHSKSVYKDKKEASWSIEESIKLNNDKEVENG